MTSALRRAAIGLEDAGWLLLVIFSMPVAILIVGAPLALLGWVVTRFVP
jgi:hypothetical protein